MTRRQIRRITQRSPRAGKRPGDLIELTYHLTATVEAVTRGGTKSVIQKTGRIVDELIRAGEKAAGKISLVVKIFPVGLGPEVKKLARTAKGRFLPALEGPGEAFRLSGQTRRTGGIREARGIKNTDGSATIELAGYVQPSDAFPGDASEFRNAKHSNDFSQKLKSASEKSVGDIELTRRNSKTGRLETYEKAHLWGHGFGDEARDGIMYAPREFNQFWQNKGVEEWIRQCREVANRRGGNLVLRARARSYSPRLLKEKALASGKQTKKRINQNADEHVLKEVVYELLIESPDKPGVLQPFQRLEFEIPAPWEKDVPIKFPFDPNEALLEGLPDL